MTGPSSEPPRKKLRKGTKSCLECRRRKIRCTFDNNGNICDGCISRSLTCIGQEHAPETNEYRESTRERVNRLENVVDGLNKTVSWLKGVEDRRTPTVSGAGTPVSMGTTNLAQMDESASVRGGGNLDEGDDLDLAIPGSEPAHLKSLFPNHIRSPGIDGGINSNVSSPSSDSSWKEWVRVKLLSIVPAPGDVTYITTAASDWWIMHNALLPEPAIGSKRAFLERHKDLSDPNTQPGAIATWLVCLAQTFLQLPADFDFRQLRTISPTDDFVTTVINEVDRLILSNDALLGTVEGIECAVMMVKLYKSIGQLKKGWLALRRAISFAELLGLQQSRRALKQIRLQNHAQVPQESVSRVQLNANLWASLCALDRFICLLLSLPTTASNFSRPRGLEEYEGDNSNTLTRQFLWDLSEVANDLLQRDQIDDEDEASAATGKISQALYDLQQQMPSHWWNMERSTVYDVKNATCVLLQSTHRYLTVRAHLPYLLKARDDPRYAQNAVDCLRACREILARYFAIRTCLAAGAFLSRSFDIQAFTASVILLLYRDKIQWYSPQPEGPNADSGLLENAKLAMSRAPSRAGGNLTRKMVDTLDQIQQCFNGIEESATAPMGVRLWVPLLGAITVSKNEISHKPAPTPDMQQGLVYDSLVSSAETAILEPTATVMTAPEPFAVDPAAMNYSADFYSINTDWFRQANGFEAPGFDFDNMMLGF